MRSRSGFTLTELIVALVVFAVGGLGLVALSTTVARQVADGSSHTTAASLGASLLDSLHATRCRGAGSGIATIGQMTVGWTAADSGDAAVIQEIVSFPTTRGRRRSAVEALLSCE